MDSSLHTTYQFGEFFLSASKRLLFKGQDVIRINDRAFDVLTMLVRNAGRVVTRDEFFESVWRDVTVEPGNLDQSIFALRKALSDTLEPRRYIKTVPRRGFLFLASVTVIDESSILFPTPTSEVTTQRDEPVIAVPPPIEHANEIRLIGGAHVWHAVISCTLYAMLYAFAVPLEVAYRWETYGETAKKVAVVVFLWVLVTSLGGLVLNQKLTSRNRSGGLISLIIVFLVAAILLFGALSFFLPVFPITEATFQTYPAQAAYLKDMSYFLGLVLIFLVMPYHFIVAIENEVKRGKHRQVLAVLTSPEHGVSPRGAPYPRFWALALLLLAFLPISLYMTARLLDNLRPSPHMNLFTELVYLRALLSFGLGAECLFWYQRALNEVKRECAATEQPSH